VEQGTKIGLNLGGFLAVFRWVYQIKPTGFFWYSSGCQTLAALIVVAFFSTLSILIVVQFKNSLFSIHLITKALEFFEC